MESFTSLLNYLSNVKRCNLSEFVEGFSGKFRRLRALHGQACATTGKISGVSKLGGSIASDCGKRSARRARPNR
jgi:hypothetical protein